MQFKQLHPNFQLPTQGSAAAGGYDLYMPEAGHIKEMDGVNQNHVLIGLGFAAAVPVSFVALIFPRSGAGAKHGVALRNTCGVIDSDFRGEWMVMAHTKEGQEFGWAAGERLFQYVLVPAGKFDPVLVSELDETSRGAGGFGSSGK